MTRACFEQLFEWRFVRWLAALAFMGRGALLLLCGSRYRGISDLCWIVRVSGTGQLHRIARAVIFHLIDATRRTGRNPLIESYLRSSLSKRCAALYSLSGYGPHDIYRDLIVLKPSRPGEKGVILLKYARTFEAVIALMDFSRILERYIFVLEPCWTGYCDPALLMFIAPDNPVIVQCFTEVDHDFIASIGTPFVPVRLGPADWVNADTFQSTPKQAKIYDLVMVANWGAHKRHAQLFRALGTIDDRATSVLLIGYPWAGRTSADIRREINSIAVPRVRVEIVEAVPHTEIARYLGQCKIFVFLSKKEGDNKALVEAMFADVPAIVYNRTVGGAGSRINSATGIFSTDDELADSIRYMLTHYTDFNPRAWASEHTGSSIATRVIDEALSSVIRESGGRYVQHIVEKFNAPNLAYRDPALRVGFQADYDFITSCLRRRSVA